MRTMTFGRLLVALALLFITGCGGDDTPAGGQAPVAAAPAPATPGDGAQTAVTALIAGLNQGHPEAFWEFLPDDFQGDLNGLLHQFAERMDDELWDKTVSLLRKLAHVLKEQRRFLDAATPESAQTIGRAKEAAGHTASPPPAADWNKLAIALETVLDSDLASLERLKKADGGKLLATAGVKMIDQFRALSGMSPEYDDLAYKLARLAELRVSVVHASSDKATLKFEAPGDTPLVVAFTRHEGKWIPEDLAAEWLHGIGNARAWLSSVLSPEILAEQKPRYLSLLESADTALDTMSAAKTFQEFAVAGQHATRTLVSLVSVLLAPPDADDTAAQESQPVEAGQIVTVLVAGMLDDDAQDVLRGRLKGVCDDPGRASAEITGDDETSTFKVGPVADVQAFAGRLEFLDVALVDVPTRTITAKLRKK